MIRNYIKIAFRNLLKYKFISFINLFGLTVGLTCCLLIVAYITNELSYDRYNSKANRVYRVTRSFNNPEGVVSLQLGSVAPPFGPLLQSYFPDIQDVTRLLQRGTTPVRYQEKIFNENGVFWADEHLFNIFDVYMVRGNRQQVLTDPYTAILTEEMAHKYFGNEDPVNKIIRTNNRLNFKVTGVYKDFPVNAHLHPEIMLSFNTLRDTAIYGAENLRTNFGNNSFFTYLLLPENYPAKNLEKQFPDFLDKDVHFQGAPANFKTSKTTNLYLQKLTDIHLRSHLDSEIEENGDIKRVYIFSAIALFILLIACINYMNLSTARSALRAKEIGIRKVSGANKSELIAQFLSESILLAGMATLLAAGLTRLTLPWLNDLSGQQLSVSLLFKWQIILPIVLTPFIVGMLSGLYPALFMSSFQPVKTLKGLFRVGGGNISFRKVLVITQFAISVILIICTAIVFRQLGYMQEKSLGFNKDHIVTMNYNDALNNSYESFRSELLDDPNIKNIARSSRIPTGRLLDEMGASTESGDSLKPVTADIKYMAADHDFVPTYGVHMVAGRNFSRDFPTDTASFIVNEAAVSALGWKNARDGVGKNFKYANITGKIIGIMGDFHFESMHQKIIPIILVLPKPDQGNNFGRISVKITGNNIPAALSHLERTWKKFMPEIPFQYAFLDENFANLYKSETRQGSIFTVFACIAIFIACLGLFGLSAFAITQRIKEIGIRKVLGASVGNIVGLLSKDFLKLVIIAAVIAFPVAWYAMHNWLQDFAYRINIPWWLFLLAGIIAAAVALITISFQAIKAAIANPVKALRSE